MIDEEAKVVRKNSENRMECREWTPYIVKRVGSLERDQLLKKKFLLLQPIPKKHIS